MRRVIFIFTFIPVFILYLTTSPSTVFWQDSGIYLSGIKDLGIVYPPGFPLYVLTSWLWVKLLTPVFGGVFTYAKIVHLYSGLWGALTASVVSVFTYEMIRYFNFDKDKSINDKFAGIASVGAGLYSGISYSLWAQSINAEVYSLAGFLAISVFYIVFKIYREASTSFVLYLNPPRHSGEQMRLQNQTNVKIDSGQARMTPVAKLACEKGTDVKKLKNNLMLLAFCWGISYAVHPLTVSFAPVILYLFYYLSKNINISGIKPGEKQILSRSDKLCLSPRSRMTGVGRFFTTLRMTKGGIFTTGLFAIFFISAVTFYLYLPVRSAQDPVYLWNKIDSARALFDHITGKEYFTREISLTLFDKDKFFSFFVLIWEEFLLTVPILMYSFWILARKRITFEYLKFIFIYAVSIYVLLLMYEGGSEYKFWLIPFYSLAWTFVGYGMHHIFRKYLKNTLLAVLLVGTVLTVTLSVNWKYLNRRNYTLAYEFGSNILKNLSEGSVLFTIGDQSSSIPQYMQYVENYRTDVALVWDTTFSQKWKRERLEEKHPHLKIPESFGDGELKDDELFNAINDFIKENIGKTDIFLITRSVIPVSDEFGLVPAGTFWKVAKEVEPVDLSYWDIYFSDPGRYTHPEKRENARQIKNEKGAVTSIVRVRFSDEAKDFELQAYKNLADHCLMTYDLGGEMEVIGLDGKLQTWGKEELLLCSQKYYEKMYETDPYLNRDDVYLSLERVRGARGILGY